MKKAVLGFQARAGGKGHPGRGTSMGKGREVGGRMGYGWQLPKQTGSRWGAGEDRETAEP